MSVSVYSRLSTIAADMPAKASVAVQKAAYDVEAQAKGYAPVDTGYLRGAIMASPTGMLSAKVNAGAEYSVYQEYGTYKMGAQPFMVPAAETVRPRFIAAMRQVV